MAQMGQYWLDNIFNDLPQELLALDPSKRNPAFEKTWGAANKDYVVANRLFTFFLDITVPEECHHNETIVKRYPAGTPFLSFLLRI